MNMPRQSLDSNEMTSLSATLTEVKNIAADALREAEKVDTISADTTVSYLDLLKKMEEVQMYQQANASLVNGKSATINRFMLIDT